MRYLSSTGGTGGEIKSSPEDFIVREISQNGTVLTEDRAYSPEDLGEKNDPEGRFTRFVLQKRDWDTVNALIKIAKYISHGKKAIGYAGTKDRKSISVQLASIFGAEPEQLMQLKIKDIKINGAWKADSAVEMGSNTGNSFGITIRNCRNAALAEGTIEELNNSFPNYYDKQRFGARMNNADIGMEITKGDFKEAVMKFLTDTQNERNQESIDARKRLADEQDFKAAQEYFPKGLRNERMVLDYMAKYDNYTNALRKLPRGILIMFIHAMQSSIFNMALDSRIKEEDFNSKVSCRKNFYGFPDISQIAESGDFALGNLIGYETKADLISDYEKDALEKMELKPESFKISGIPELSMKGSYRTLLCPVKDAKCEAENNSLKVNFSIPSGSYATIFLGELMKTQG